MPIRYMNLSVSNKKLRKPYLKAFDAVLKHGIFILGEEVEVFEKSVAEYCGVKYAVGVGSGTDALVVALLALGISQGDEVIIPDMSFIATANAVALIGAKPLFCDIEDDFNIDTKKIESLISPKTKAIVAVHYGGKIADMDAIKQIAKKHGLKVIEDASQAFGAIYKGKKAGSVGDVGCFSLNPMKTLGALGEAGVITTNSKKLYNKFKTIRSNGLDENRRCVLKAMNAKIDTLQAAFLNIKLESFEKNIKKRNQIARYYTKQLQTYVTTPKYRELEKSSCLDVYYSYTILVDKKHRDQLVKFMLEREIEVKINHTSMHKEPAYKEKGENLKRSIEISKQKIAIPCNETLSKKEIKYVAQTIKEFFEKKVYDAM